MNKLDTTLKNNITEIEPVVEGLCVTGHRIKFQYEGDEHVIFLTHIRWDAEAEKLPEETGFPGEKFCTIINRVVEHYENDERI